MNKMKLLLGFLAAYSILITIFVFRFWNYFKSGNDKNYKTEWSADLTHFYSISKKTGYKASISIDANFDQNFEKSSSYDEDGDKVSEAYDRNENGIYELNQSYSKKGDVVAEWYDRNEDGIYEEGYNINASGEMVMKQFDSNEDGILDSLEIPLDNANLLHLSDIDQNGHFKIMK